MKINNVIIYTCKIIEIPIRRGKEEEKFLIGRIKTPNKKGKLEILVEQTNFFQQNRKITIIQFNCKSSRSIISQKVSYRILKDQQVYKKSRMY